jgi:hypothetical protein
MKRSFSLSLSFMTATTFMTSTALLVICILGSIFLAGCNPTADPEADKFKPGTVTDAKGNPVQPGPDAKAADGFEGTPKGGKGKGKVP